jgi:uncharacterized protein (TIGR02266 family)
MSATEKRERRGHFRGKPRPGRRVEVEFRGAESGAGTLAHTRNIGVGGAFIVTATPPQPGTHLILTLHVPTPAKKIEVKAEVRWTSSVDGATGMGVKFYGLDVEELLQLNEYFASLTGRDESAS